jgi:hypothetical protein
MSSQKKIGIGDIGIGDLVVYTFDGEWSEDPEVMLVVGLREAATGPYAICTLLRPDATTFERYDFELQLLKEEGNDGAHQTWGGCGWVLCPQGGTL